MGSEERKRAGGRKDGHRSFGCQGFRGHFKIDPGGEFPEEDDGAASTVTLIAAQQPDLEFATTIKIGAPAYPKEMAGVRNTPMYPSFWEIQCRSAVSMDDLHHGDLTHDHVQSIRLDGCGFCGNNRAALPFLR